MLQSLSRILQNKNTRTYAYVASSNRADNILSGLCSYLDTLVDMSFQPATKNKHHYRIMTVLNSKYKLDL